MEFLVVLRLPGHFDADPALAGPPVWVAEETSAVKVLVFTQEVFVGNPEGRIRAESVIELFLDLGRPFFGAVRPGTFPVALFDLAPGISVLLSVESAKDGRMEERNIHT